ncbi:uncharacterized protein LOC110687374 [Chenopodium quinoa]|uniref:uncharacterized protein LOC110687374 n=1 Tax=Chenopodium quinoa TaxID=63459 RepID=UPI000B786930|nr:uncharacterized protein LOC110687374 [Chenopodium quinoa]XP_021719712.1 uncharacterized protein LOC110687374 [Chenopodium quinoa]
MAGRNGRKFAKDEDFEEGEVWNVLESRENSSPKLRKSLKNSSSATKKFTATARMIPKSSSSSSCEKMSSAPLEIPDWSKIYGVTSKKKKNGGSASSWVDYNAVNHQGYYGNCHGNDYGHGYGYDDGPDVNDDGDGYVYGNDGNDDGDDDDDDMVPPHEYLAKKLARSQISSFSVYEGIGRTLKGRDLSKVRNAILTKTGFLE